MGKKYRGKTRRGRAIEAAYSIDTEPRTLKRLSWTLNSTIAIGVATNPNTPSSALSRIARWHTNPEVIQRVPHHRNVSARTLSYIMKKHSAMHPTALLAVVQREDCPPEVLERVCYRKLKGGHLAAEWLAKSPQTQENLLYVIYQNWIEPSVVVGLAGNQRTPREILVTMMELSTDESVLVALASNPAFRDDEKVLIALRLLSVLKPA